MNDNSFILQITILLVFSLKELTTEKQNDYKNTIKLLH